MKTVLINRSPDLCYLVAAAGHKITGIHTQLGVMKAKFDGKIMSLTEIKTFLNSNYSFENRFSGEIVKA